MEVKYFTSGSQTLQKCKIIMQDNEDFNNTHKRHVTTKKISADKKYLPQPIENIFRIAGENRTT